ncbi:hypothetical protein H0H92_011408 [Tricholoma furcatifolium]|nr:hypothetical protein H0H92_011408 [Tricholoma furcatifolium]
MAGIVIYSFHHRRERRGNYRAVTSGTYVYLPPTGPVAVRHSLQQASHYTLSSPASAYSAETYRPLQQPSRDSSPHPQRLALPAPSTGSAYYAGYDSVWGTGMRSSGPPSSASSQSAAHWPGIRPPSLSSGAGSYSVGRKFSVAPSEVHALLNAQSPHPEFCFDLSRSTCGPCFVRPNGQAMAISPQELSQPVTYPPITRLRILLDDLPENWAIRIDHTRRADNAYTNGGRAITVNDVIQALHRKLHLQISFTDNERLSPEGYRMVQEAYTRRWKSASQGSKGNGNEKALGLKRVDYLGRNTKVVGLLRAPSDEGWDVMRLVTSG